VFLALKEVKTVTTEDTELHRGFSQRYSRQPSERANCVVIESLFEVCFPIENQPQYVFS
jgi:hypothetical protein